MQNFGKNGGSMVAGQAKLNSLRFDIDMESPKYINSQLLEDIANEDLWEEFLSIEIGHWCNKDLRKLSLQSDLKELYDSYYSWTSGYTHGAWGAVRESCYETCGNPLHRFHRYPKYNQLYDTVYDSAQLVNLILDDLDRAYPEFKPRFLS